MKDEEWAKSIQNLSSIVKMLREKGWTLDVVFSPQHNPDVPQGLPSAVFDSLVTEIPALRRHLLDAFESAIAHMKDITSKMVVFHLANLHYEYERVLLGLIGLSHRLAGGILDVIAEEAERDLQETIAVEQIKESLAKRGEKGKTKRKKPKRGA